MIEISVHSEINNSEAEVYYSAFGLDKKVFSLDAVKDIFATNESETDFKLNIHCDGGSVSEGLAIYDFLRTSGKTIHANIEGKCHSMAVTLLLAAPKENRTANPNVRALIHKVRGLVVGYETADTLQAYSEDIKKEEDAIINIYAERTGVDKETLQGFINAEKELTAQELKDNGFISRINTYNTNLKKENMDILKTINEKLDKLTGLFNKDFEVVELVNEELPEVTLETEVEETEVDTLKATIKDLQDQLAKFEEMITEKDETINEQKKTVEDVLSTVNEIKEQIKSQGVAPSRTVTPKAPVNRNEEIINKFKETRKKIKGEN